jgi:hypothetical protein
MRKIALIIALLAASLSLSAQNDNTPIIPQPDIIVVDNFVGCPSLTLEMFQYIRNCAMDALGSRGRLKVINVEDYGIGRADIIYPSTSMMHSYHGTPIDLNRLSIMEEFPEARYYYAAHISSFNVRPKSIESKDKEGKITVRETFAGYMEVHVFCYDVIFHRTIADYSFNVSKEIPNPEECTRSIAGETSSKVRGWVNSNFRFKCSVIQLGEFNKKGKLQDLYLSCGSNIGASRGDIFYIYQVSEIGGIETGKKIGKVKLKEITGPDSCRCSVSNGEAEIQAAFQNGDYIVAISDYDQFF